MGDELDKEIERVKQNRKSDEKLIFAAISYWKLVQISCIPIYRNQEWFNSKVPKLRKFWDDVLLYRQKSLKDLEKYIDTKKKVKKKKDSNEYKKTKMTDYYETILKEVNEESKDSSNNIFIGIEDNKDESKDEDNKDEENVIFSFDSFIKRKKKLKKR